MFYCLFIGYMIVIMIYTQNPPMNKKSNVNALDSIIISEIMVEFIYANAVSFMEGTRISMKSLSDRGLYLLSYLLIVVGYFITYAFTHFRLSISDDLSNISICIIFYYGYISFYLVQHMKPRNAFSPHVQPHILLIPERALSDISDAKTLRIYELEAASTKNLETIDTMKSCLDASIALAFIIPFILYGLRKLFLFCKRNYFNRFR